MTCCKKLDGLGSGGVGKTDSGTGAGGTVTYVDFTSSNPFLAASGGPITTEGVLNVTLSGIPLDVAHGGTGVTTKTGTGSVVLNNAPTITGLLTTGAINASGPISTPTLNTTNVNTTNVTATGTVTAPNLNGTTITGNTLNVTNVNSSGTITSNNVVVNGTLVANTFNPINTEATNVDIVNPNTSFYLTPLKVIAPNNSVGGNTTNIAFGVDNSPKNLGYIGFNYSSSGSNSNFVTIGLNNADHLVKVLGSGEVFIAGRLYIPALHLNGFEFNYLRGSWTPEISLGTIPFSYVTRLGSYRVYGDTITVHFTIVYNITGTGTPSPFSIIRPYNFIATESGYSNVLSKYTDMNPGTALSGKTWVVQTGGGGSQNFIFSWIGADTGQYVFYGSQLYTNCRIEGSLTYNI